MPDYAATNTVTTAGRTVAKDTATHNRSGCAAAPKLQEEAAKKESRY